MRYKKIFGTKGLHIRSKIEILDNSGIKRVRMITSFNRRGVYRRYYSAGIGDIILGSVIKGKAKFKGDQVKVLILTQKKPFKNLNGETVQFSYNGGVVLKDSDDLELRGNKISGIHLKEMSQILSKISSYSDYLI